MSNKQKPSLLEQVKQKEQEAGIQNESEHQELQLKEKRKSTLNKILATSGKSGVKDRSFSGKINSGVYELFTAINKKNGLSNNSALNLIITEYVREKKYLLEEEE